MPALRISRIPSSNFCWSPPSALIWPAGTWLVLLPQREQRAPGHSRTLWTHAAVTSIRNEWKAWIAAHDDEVEALAQREELVMLFVGVVDPQMDSLCFQDAFRVQRRPYVRLHGQQPGILPLLVCCLSQLDAQGLTLRNHDLRAPKNLSKLQLTAHASSDHAVCERNRVIAMTFESMRFGSADKSSAECGT